MEGFIEDDGYCGTCHENAEELRVQREQAEASAAQMREKVGRAIGALRGDTGGSVLGNIALAHLSDALSSTAGKSFLEEREKDREARDNAYHERDQVVALLARMALALGWNVGVGRHPDSDATWENDWRTIVFVDLPTGQASWHFHDSERELLSRLQPYAPGWDGHSTPEKYERVNKALPTVEAVAVRAERLRDEKSLNVYRAALDEDLSDICAGEAWMEARALRRSERGGK